MASYIGKVQIGTEAAALIGSTLYGICYTAASNAQKDITANTTTPAITGDYVNTNYDRLIRGSTIHIKFVYGNTVTSNASLLVGTLTTPINVVGNFTCPANTVISFTLDENQNWVVNDNVDTNIEYVFKTPYDPSTNQVIGTADIGTAAEKDTVNALVDADKTTTNDNIPTATAVVSYVLDKTAGLTGLTGAMHFKGAVTTVPPESGTYESGDVVLGPNNKEYVYNGTTWIELGDEGSYVLQTSQTTDIIDEVTSWEDGELPELTVTDTAVSNVSITTPGVAASLTPQPMSIPNVTHAGTATTASVEGGVLTINIGTNTTLGDNVTFDAVGSWTANTPTVINSTPVTVGSASGWRAGALPTLGRTPTTVVVPVTSNP